MTFDVSLATQIEIAFNLFLAGLLGALIGLEREHLERPAGLRTNTLIAIGAAIFGMIGTYGFVGDGASASRVMQNVITGVGFLGTGAVLKGEHGVQGLTTAAGVWAAAALGLAVAAKLYFLAVAGEVLVLVTLFILRRFERRIKRQSEAAGAE